MHYTDQGIPLARTLELKVVEYADMYGVRPKSIYLQNHEFIAVAATANEVFRIMQMADKSARIRLGSFACGGPKFLTEEQERRIATRPDEHQRQCTLELKLEN